MPLYDYACTACGTVFEGFGSSDGKGGTDPCPDCGSAEVKQQIVSRMAVRTSRETRGRVVDLSSGACPCAAHGHRH